MIATTEVDTKHAGSVTWHDERTDSTDPFSARDSKVGESLGTQCTAARIQIDGVSDDEEPPPSGDLRSHGEPLRVTKQEL
jgi:hypothetical protein